MLIMTTEAQKLGKNLKRIRKEKGISQGDIVRSLGMDRASFANLATDAKKQIGLWAEAMTYYAKAQLYAQMAKTTLLKARTGVF